MFPVVIAVVLLIIAEIVVAIIYSQTYKDDPGDPISTVYRHRNIVFISNMFFGSLKFYVGYSNIKASLITKFIIFLIASLITHFTSAKMLPSTIFCFFTVMAAFVYIYRMRDARSLPVEMNEADLEFFDPDIRSLKAVYTILFLFQVALQIILLFVF